MDYQFIYDSKNWWLKLTDTEQIIDYHRQTSSRYEGAISLYMKIKQEGKDLYDFMDGLPHRERIELLDIRDYKYLHCVLIKAEKTGGTLFDGIPRPEYGNQDGRAGDGKKIRRGIYQFGRRPYPWNQNSAVLPQETVDISDIWPQ